MSTAEGPRATILLVEDDQAVATILLDTLGARGYCVWHAASAAEAEVMFDETSPDLLILDLSLPDTHGLVLCANLREKRAVPIIICSGTRRKDDPLLSFKLGADDFIAKPFSVDELEARVEVALRRTAPRPAAAESRPVPRVQRLGDVHIDVARCQVTLGGEVVRLTPTEYHLLCALADRPNEVHSREELARSVWSQCDRGILRSLEVHVRRLRAKLETDGKSRLLTVRGFGYRLTSEPEADARG